MIFNIGGKASPPVPEFSGSSAVFGDGKKGYIELYTSGTLTLKSNMVVDVFVVGGGKPGETGKNWTTSNDYPVQEGGTGGGGSVGLTGLQQALSKGDYSVVIGSSGGNSSAFGKTTSQWRNTGGRGAVGTLDDSYRSNGKAGNYGTSVPFGNDYKDNIFYRYYGAGGGGGSTSYGSYAFQAGAGGNIGGGAGATSSSSKGVAGTANTGSGGGGGFWNYSNTHGAGGSGIVIVRWGW